MNWDLRDAIISPSEKVDARSSTPLFQVQPSGCPSMAQINKGFFSSAAIPCACSSDTCHGIVRQGALAGVLHCCLSVSKSPKRNSAAPVVGGYARMSRQRMITFFMGRSNEKGQSYVVPINCHAHCGSAIRRSPHIFMRALFRSLMRSLAFSSPTEIRMSPKLMPKSLNRSGGSSFK